MATAQEIAQAIAEVIPINDFSADDFGGDGGTTPFFIVKDNDPTALSNKTVKSGGVFDMFKDHGVVDALQSLGSTIKALPLGAPLMGVMNNGTPYDGVLHFVAVHVTKACTITGVRFKCNTAGVFTASGFNGAALFSNSAGILTQIAISANDGSIYKTKGVINVPFTASVDIEAGVYFACMSYDQSAETTAPRWMQIGGDDTILDAFGFTNSAKLAAYKWQTPMPSTIESSALTIMTYVPYLMLY